MKKRNIVFFVLSVLFLAVAVLFSVLSLTLFAELGNTGGAAGDLGEAGGEAAAATAIAILGVLFAVAGWIAAGLSSLFAALNLRAGIKWMQIFAVLTLGICLCLVLATVIPLLLRAG